MTMHELQDMDDQRTPATLFQGVRHCAIGTLRLRLDDMPQMQSQSPGHAEKEKYKLAKISVRIVINGDVDP